MIKLVALDLDQTLFGSDMVVRPRARATVQQAIEAGIVVTIATGRETPLAAKFAEELGLRAPIICSQGGCIYDHLRRQVLHEERLPAAILPKIIEAAERFQWSYHFEVFDRLFFPAKSRHPEPFFELLRYSNWVRLGDVLKDMPERPNKIVVAAETLESKPRVMRELQETLGNDLTILSSHPHLIEAMPKGIDKGFGLAWLAAHLQIEAPATLAIGDSEADIPMLKWAGVAVAMGNATAPVKAAATWVAPALEEDGAAIAMERFLFSRQA